MRILSCRELAVAAASIAIAMFASVGMAQQTQSGTAGQRPAVQPGTTPGAVGAPAAGAYPAYPQPGMRGMMGPDAPLATLIDIGNQKEIALSQFAVGRAQNPNVKAFAQQMIHEHSEFGSRLAPYTGGLMSLFTAEWQGQQGQTGAQAVPGTVQQPRTAAAPQAGQQGRYGVAGQGPMMGPGQGPMMGPGRGPIFLRIKNDIARRDVDLTERDWSQKNGADFDRAYLNQQLVEHTGMLAALETARSFASPRFRQVLDQGVQTTQKHLDHIKGLLAQLEGAAVHQAERPGQAR